MPDKDVLLLDPATGKPVCRKEVSTLVDQLSIIGNSDAATPFRVNYPVVADALAGSGVAANAGKLDAALVHNATGTTANATSGAGTTASPLTARQATDAVTGVVELTGSAQMPAEKTRDDSALTPAGAAKLVGYIKPVASTGALSAAQQSADAIEVPMLSDFSCNGGTRGAPRFTVPVAGGGSCAIDFGNLPYYSVDNPPPSNDGVIAQGTVLASNVSGCFKLPEVGLYLITGLAAVGNANIYVYNAGFKASHPSPCLDLLFNNKNCYTIRSASVTPPYTPVNEPFAGNPNWIGTAGCNFFTITYNGMVRMWTEADGLGFTGFTVTKM